MSGVGLLIVGVLIILLAFTGGCIPEPAPSGDSSSIVPMIIFIGVIFAAFYFLMIRPQRKKLKEHQEMVHELRKGDHVITAGGIFGQIESMNEESVVLKIEGGTTIRIARGSIIGTRERGAK